jgi:hypothetical protein
MPTALDQPIGAPIRRRTQRLQQPCVRLLPLALSQERATGRHREVPATFDRHHPKRTFRVPPRPCPDIHLPAPKRRRHHPGQVGANLADVPARPRRRLQPGLGGRVSHPPERPLRSGLKRREIRVKPKRGPRSLVRPLCSHPLMLGHERPPLPSHTNVALEQLLFSLTQRHRHGLGLGLVHHHAPLHATV